MFRKHIYPLFSVIILLVLGACSNTKYLAKDDSLVVKNTVKIVEDEEVEKLNELSAGIKARIRPRSNKKFLSTRLPQWIYNQGAKKEMEEGEDNFLMRLGEEPNLMDSTLVEDGLENISNYLFNNGFFNPDLSYVSETEEQKTTVNYTVELNKRHYFNNSSFDIKDSVLNNIIQQKFNTEEAIKPGEPYVAQELEKLRAEIVSLLQNEGYYRFSSASIYIEADTLAQSGKVDVKVVVENPSDSLYNKRFQIRNILVQMSLGPEDTVRDTVQYNEKLYYNSQLAYMRPSALDPFILFQKGEDYNRKKHTRTINKLYDLPIVDFANVEFRENTKNGYYLDALVTITAGARRVGTFEPEVSQFRGIGSSARLAYKNKNFAKGGELFELAVKGGFEVIDGDFFGVTFYEIESDLFIPKIVGMPFKNTLLGGNTSNPRTRIAASAGSQNLASLYRNREIGVSQRWDWKSSPLNEHSWSLINISRLETGNFSPEFEDFLKANPAIDNSFEDRFIIGGNYNYVYNNALVRPGKSFMRFEALLDYSGNMLNGISKVFGVDTLKLFDFKVAQYVKADVDFAYNFPIANRTSFVTHLNVGVATAKLGNGEKVPAIKQFTLGGSNSMRAWNQRSLGPGTYDVEADTDVVDKDNIDQRSDLKLEANVELRFPLTKLFGFDLNGAVFTDAGNIWAIDDDIRPGADDYGFGSIAVGSGFGLRLDIQNLFVVRTDWGYKIIDPARPEGDRFEDTPFSSANLTVGIGYPF